MPYATIKETLKTCLLQAQDPALKSLICHALAVTNFSELSDHNDRIADVLEQGGEDSIMSYSKSPQAEQDLRKDRIEKKKEKAREERMRVEMELQRRR